jgi:predicted RND superfamily exporter protein
MENRSSDQRTKYTRNSRTISGRLHDELVMMDLEQGKYFSLNPVATRIWDLLEKEMTLDELCALLTEEYDVESNQCMDEVRELLEEMEKLGLVGAFRG